MLIKPKTSPYDDSLLVNEALVSSEHVPDNIKCVDELQREPRFKATSFYLKIIKDEFNLQKKY